MPKDHCHCDYAARNEHLRHLGFQNYAHYLDSALWHSIRNKAIHDALSGCAICRDQATEVHHRRYTRKNLAEYIAQDMVALCAKCHDAIEFKTTGKLRRKRQFVDVQHMLTVRLQNGTLHKKRKRRGRKKVIAEPKNLCRTCGRPLGKLVLCTRCSGGERYTAKTKRRKHHETVKAA